MNRRRTREPGEANAAEATGNLITNQDLSTAYWTKSGFTTVGSTGLRETATTSAHSFTMAAGLTRPAGTGTYRHTADIIKVGPDQRFLALGLFSIGLGAGSYAFFDVLNGTTSGPASYGGFPAPTPVISAIAGGYRCQITSGPLAGAFAGIIVLDQDSTPIATFSYLGVITDGYTITNLTLTQLG